MNLMEWKIYDMEYWGVLAKSLKGLNDKPLPGKWREDRWDDMQPRRRNDDEYKSVPGKFNEVPIWVWR